MWFTIWITQAYCHQTPRPRINRKRMETTANTRRIWINDPRLKTKKPNSHPTNKITAIKYNKSLMIVMFWFAYCNGKIMPYCCIYWSGGFSLKFSKSVDENPHRCGKLTTVLSIRGKPYSRHFKDLLLALFFRYHFPEFESTTLVCIIPIARVHLLK